MRKGVLVVGTLLALGGLSVAAGEEGWIALFDGKDKAGWVLRNPKGYDSWKVVDGCLVNTPDPIEHGTDIVTVKQFWNFDLHVEYRIPKGSNSGIYLRGRYEIQILDDFGRPASPGGNGSIYSQKVASKNASKRAGEWQSVDARLVGREVTVVLNGETIIDRHRLTAATGGALERIEDLPGPLMLQGNHGAVAFRNIRIRPIRSPGEGWIRLFDGRTKKGWRLTHPGGRDSWTAENEALHNVPAGHGTDLMTVRDDFFNFQLYLEYMVPRQGSNSGIYLRGNYEIQVLGDHGRAPSRHGNGAIYGRRAPSVNASPPAGRWQTLHALIRQEAKGPRIWVVLNDRRVIDGYLASPPGTTGGPLDGSADAWRHAGPLRLQGDHGEVWYRNIWIKPLPGSPAGRTAGGSGSK